MFGLIMLGHLRRLEIVKTFTENKLIEGIYKATINLRRKSIVLFHNVLLSCAVIVENEWHLAVTICNTFPMF